MISPHQVGLPPALSRRAGSVLGRDDLKFAEDSSRLDGARSRRGKSLISRSRPATRLASLGNLQSKRSRPSRICWSFWILFAAFYAAICRRVASSFSRKVGIPGKPLPNGPPA